ncbi:MAG: L-fuconolactonase [Acidimicrobiales bacterium]
MPVLGIGDERSLRPTVCVFQEPAKFADVANYDRHEWLTRRQETAIDADRPIIDPHHHLWDREGSTYLSAELGRDTQVSHNVKHTVFVECSSAYDEGSSAALAPVGETRFAAAQAEEAQRRNGPMIAGIVGHADMSLGEGVDDILVQHEQAGAGLFRGIRHGTNWSPHRAVKNGHHEPGPGLLLDPTFQAGVRRLGLMGHSFDAWLYFDQLHELATLAQSVPECAIVVDHLGGPLGIGPHAAERADMVRLWRDGIVRIASCPNVMLKIGGLGMEHYFGSNWAGYDTPPSSDEVAAFWHDMVHVAIDSFGPSRCMFESNFPVDRQTLPYTVLWNSFEILAASYNQAEQHELFFGTANRFYRLGAEHVLGDSRTG